MRYSWMLLVFIIAALEFGCASTPHRRGQWFTGTCSGACDYYAHCKARSGEKIGPEVQTACVTECTEVFSSRQSILAFESLVCEDAVAFVEGQSGRAPGEPFE